MRTITRLLRPLIDLFVDDGSLCISILATVLISGVVAHFSAARPIIGGMVLLAGCLVALISNVIASSRRA